MTDFTSVYIGVIALTLGIAILWIVVLRKRKGKAPEAEPSREAKPVEADVFKKIHESFSSKLENLLLGTKSFDDKFADSLEEVLYTADVGPHTVEKLLSQVRARLSRGDLKDLATVKDALFSDMKAILSRDGGIEVTGKPHVVLVVGVNGVGKTTTIGKMAHWFSTQGKKVLIVAGDTFRAAAQSQLEVWGERASVDVYTSERTKDPSAIAYEGVQQGLAKNSDVVIVDTAGRLHTKENLMEELKKVKRVIAKVIETAPHDIILVVDGHSGQNALNQAREFNHALGLTGVVVTKLDGTARGGVILGIAEELNVGVKFVGVGEKLGDLKPFKSDEFLKGLLRL